MMAACVYPIRVGKLLEAYWEVSVIEMRPLRCKAAAVVELRTTSPRGLNAAQCPVSNQRDPLEDVRIEDHQQAHRILQDGDNMRDMTSWVCAGNPQRTAILTGTIAKTFRKSRGFSIKLSSV
jgi:hypothetical protein